ncbi:hypothetical protein K523DRAFT_375798 [Schizophyllum commune Tattone D]|nr:hypothetical protein K523DRAFT_375798 [Schizophyllum commune Tattone D]
MAAPEDLPLPEPLDIEGELQILSTPRPLVVISTEEIRQNLHDSIYANLLMARMPLYPAIALPICVIFPLASRGVAGLTVSTVTRNVSIYGYLPTYLSSWAEAHALCANRPLAEVLEIRNRLRSDVSVHESRFNYWSYGLWLGAVLGLFRKLHVYPLPPGVLGTIADVLETAFFLGGSSGVYCFYARQFRSTDIHAALLEKMRSIERHSAWYQDYALTQASSALKIAATSSLVAIPTALGSAIGLRSTVDNFSSLPFVRLYARRAGFWGGLGLLAVIPIMHDLVVEGITPSSAVQEYRAALHSDTSRAWDKHILCGALLGGSSVPYLIKRAPTIHIMRNVVRVGQFMRSPRNVFILGSASIMLGGSLGSLTFVARHLLKSGSNRGGEVTP